MSAEVTEAIRQTRRTLAEKTWVPWAPRKGIGECCLVTALPDSTNADATDLLRKTAGTHGLAAWNDRQSDVGAVLGMTLQALISELCKPTPHGRTAAR